MTHTATATCKARRSCKARDRHDDLLHMAATGEHAMGAAARLGLSVDTLYSWCRRHGELALYETLAGRIMLTLDPTG